MKSRPVMIIAIFVAVSLVGATIMVIYGSFPAKTGVDDRGVRITGIYGVRIPFEEIVSVEVADAIPRVKMRTNGYGLAGVSKGYFSVEDWGKTRLFTHSQQKGPYLIITDKSGLRTAYKTSGRSEAENLCDSIRAGMQ